VPNGRGGCASKKRPASKAGRLPMKKGQPVRADYQYERNGTANLFMTRASKESALQPDFNTRQSTLA
jgi:hypothetical protein